MDGLFEKLNKYQKLKYKFLNNNVFEFIFYIKIYLIKNTLLYMNCIFKKKVYNTITPPEIEELCNDSKFKSFAKDEIFLFYRKFRVITRGKNTLSKE